MGRGQENDNTNKRNEVNRMVFSSGKPNISSILDKKTKKDKGNINSSGANTTNLEELYNNPLLLQVQKKVINQVDSVVIQKIKKQSELKKHIETLLDTISESDFPNLTKAEKTMVVQSIMDELTGFGPLEKLIQDNSVSEIMVNGPNQIYVEQKGVLKLTNVKFRDDQHVMQIIDKIVSPLGRRIDESSPMVDARLPDGSRLNAIIPPLSLIGPVLTIRKFSSVPLTMSTLVNYGTLNEKMAKFLQLAVQAKQNIIVAGGTGSGKTTFLNVLSSNISHGERIITIEDAAELKLTQPHVISLESRPPNIEGRGEISIRDLVRNSLRMRPDRIVIGEVRGAETLDMLQAMNTGHSGSLSTVHANSPRDVLSRLETMVMYTGMELPIQAIRQQVSSAIDLVVYLERFSDGSRKVTSITEVEGMEGDVIVLQEIFNFQKKGKSNGKVRGEFKSLPIRSKIFDKFDALGIRY